MNYPRGVDDKGRIHGSDAIDLLLASIPPGPAWNKGQPVNNWDAADDAVENADDATVRAALRRLLALNMFALQDENPRCAARNLKIGDKITYDGIPAYVDAIPVRGTGAIHFKVRLHNPVDGLVRTMVIDPDVEVALLARADTAQEASR